MPRSLLRVDSLTVRFRGLVAVAGVSFDVRAGEIFGLIGPNGAGKTTCLNAITGFVRPSSGVIEFEGRSCRDLRPDQVAARGLVRTFQITSVFQGLTVLDHILVGSHLQTRCGLWDAVINRYSYREAESALRVRASEILDLLGLSSHGGDRADTLSYGDQRHLEIATALAAKPKLLLLDEPAAGLNPDECAVLRERIRSIRDSGVTVLLVEHAMPVVMGTCDRIAVLDFGAKIAEGSAAEIAHDPNVITTYLGKRRA